MHWTLKSLFGLSEIIQIDDETKRRLNICTPINRSRRSNAPSPSHESKAAKSLADKAS